MAGETRVGIFAKEYIPAGVELTFDYHLVVDSDTLVNSDRKVCHCGAANCSGFIGLKPSVIGGGKKAVSDKSGVAPAKKKRKLVKKPSRVHDDSCFKCQDGGSLLMCDFKNCTKAYHLECLGQNSPPRGKWYCPYHHCDVCGKKSLLFCRSCPNSYCNMEHAQEYLKHANPFTLDADSMFTCSVHDQMQGSELAGTPTCSKVLEWSGPCK